MSRPHPIVAWVAAGRPIRTRDVTLDVVDSAIEHRMAGVVLRACGDALDDLPTAAAAKLTAYDMGIAARRQQLLAVLRFIDERLKTAGIPYILFKGPVSAARYFPDPIMRPFADLDVVIPDPMRLREAARALVTDDRDLELLERMKPGSIDTLSVTVQDVSVDLQTDPLRLGIGPRNRGAWTERTKDMELEEVGTVRVYDDEADLLIFLLHQARDRFRYALGITEGRFRFGSEIDWSRLEDMAREEGILEQVSVAANVICDELDLVSASAPPPGWRSRLWNRLWGPQVRLLGEVGRFRNKRRASWLMPLTARGRAREAMGWILRRAFPSDVELRLRHPNAAGPYLWRLISARIRIAFEQRLWAHRREASG